jgi:hypothetical protein
MPGLRSSDIPAWKIALKGGDLNPLQNMLKKLSNSSNNKKKEKKRGKLRQFVDVYCQIVFIVNIYGVDKNLFNRVFEVHCPIFSIEI